MKAKLLFVSFCALLAITFGLPSWARYTEARSLHAELDQEREEQASLKGQLTALAAQKQALVQDLEQIREKQVASEDNLPLEEKRMRSVSRALATIAERQAPDEVADANGAPKREPRPPMGPQGNTLFPELLGNTAYAALCATVFRQDVSVIYGPLLAHLQLSPSDMEKFKQLLVDEDMAHRDTAGLLNERAMSGGEEPTRHERVKSSVSLLNTFAAEVKQTFGSDAYEKFRAFKNSAQARSLLEPLALRLSYTREPLRDAQYAELIALIQAGRNGVPKFTTEFSPDEINRAETILTSFQMQRLRELDAEQKVWRSATVHSVVSVHSGGGGAAPTPPRAPSP